VIAWRLCSAKWADSAFSGEGARIAGGRWNERGTRLVYLGQSLSLCALEVLVHVDPRDAPAFVAIRVEVPDGLVLRVEELGPLPADWRRIPAPAVLGETGSRWARSAASAVLSVPSAIIPEERNYLLNPDHPDRAHVLAGTAEPFTFDPRLVDR
jgi:RES domain-containing protein